MTGKVSHGPVLLRAWAERYRSSLFYVPLLHLTASLVLAQVMLWLDTRFEAVELPLILKSSVDNARALLGAVSGATITVAGIVFSVTMVAVQLASTQFSPRVLRGFMRDRFQQHVMGYLVGTFAYCLLVLRTIRVNGENEEVLPNLSIAIAVVLGIGAVIAIIAFIDHTARAIQVGHIIRSITDETLEMVRRRELVGASEPADPGPLDPGPLDPGPRPPPGVAAHVVEADGSGWLQQLDLDVLLAVLDPGSTLLFHSRVGRFVSQGMAIATVWPVPDDIEAFDGDVHDAIQLGATRTMQQDLSFGLRQLVDIAARALSPGINDPTTAYEVLVHLRTIVFEICSRRLEPAVVRGEHGETVHLSDQLSYRDYVSRAFNQVRELSTPHPELAIELLKTMALLIDELHRRGTPQAVGELRHQAALVLEAAEGAGHLPADLERVRRVARHRGFA